MRQVYKYPNNALCQFRWGYAAFRSLSITTTKQLQFNMQEVCDALANVQFPNSYSYARIRFPDQELVWRNQKLKYPGERLLALEPKDYSVKYELTRLLSYSTRSNDVILALQYAQELTQDYPKKPQPYSLLAGAYSSRFVRTHDKSDGKAAIAAYQKYLALTPLNDTWRAQAQRIIVAVQNDNAHWNGN